MVVVSPMQSTKVISSAREGCGYNVIFRYQWHTNTNALPMHIIDMIDRITETRKWGWTFKPHKNMDYSRADWYKDQTLIITFEDQADLIQTKLEIAHLL